MLPVAFTFPVMVFMIVGGMFQKAPYVPSTFNGVKMTKQWLVSNNGPFHVMCKYTGRPLAGLFYSNLFNPPLCCRVY